MLLFEASAFAQFTAGFAVAVSLVFLAGKGIRRLTTKEDRPERSEPSEIFILRAGVFASANFSGQQKLNRIPGDDTYDLKLRGLLSTRFDDVDRLLAKPCQVGDLSKVSADGVLQIIREVAGDEVRLEVMPRTTSELTGRDTHSLDAEAEELKVLRAQTKTAPFLLWRQKKSGDVIWANKTYLDTAREIFGEERTSTWPIPRIFQSLDTTQNSEQDLKRIQPSPNDDGTGSWFDCHMTELDGDTLCTAFPADEAVRSEARRQEFTQTLTTTFSDLDTGLAIFDRSRQLALFNPAVTDLTSIPVDILSSRPSLMEFLDQLRNKRVMPEPRDYRSWRQTVTSLEAAAMDGTYSDTWSLPDGRTYRVSGRPHPDGAFALLFEDITAEMSLTRRFRTQLEESQSVVDALDEAVAIFSASGELTFYNASYKTLWDEKRDDSAMGMTVVEATRDWHKLSVPTPVWGDFRDFAFQASERSEWAANVQLRDGRHLMCRFVPQRAGATLVVFHIQSTQHGQDRLRQAG